MEKLIKFLLWHPELLTDYGDNINQWEMKAIVLVVGVVIAVVAWLIMWANASKKIEEQHGKVNTGIFFGFILTAILIIQVPRNGWLVIIGFFGAIIYYIIAHHFCIWYATLLTNKKKERLIIEGWEKTYDKYLLK